MKICIAPCTTGSDMPPGDRPGADDSLSTLDQFTELFVVLDQAWRVVRLNRAARGYLTRLGLDPDGLTGKVIWNEVPALVGTPLFRGAERAVREPVSYTHLRAHETPEHLVC